MKARDTAHRNMVLRAWDAGQRAAGVTSDYDSFKRWYDEAYPPPPPPEPEIGAVRGGVFGDHDIIWHRRHDGLWYSADSDQEGYTWESIATSNLLDSGRVFVELPQSGQCDDDC